MVGAAIAAGDEIVLPLNAVFSISHFLKYREESNWNSSLFDSHVRNIVVTILTRVSKEDRDFPCYSAATWSPKYQVLGDKFYDTFVDFVVAGFRQPSERLLECRVKRLIRETVQHLLDRVRKTYNMEHGTLATETLASDARQRIEAGDTPRKVLKFPSAQ